MKCETRQGKARQDRKRHHNTAQRSTTHNTAQQYFGVRILTFCRGSLLKRSQYIVSLAAFVSRESTTLSTENQRTRRQGVFRSDPAAGNKHERNEEARTHSSSNARDEREDEQQILFAPLSILEVCLEGLVCVSRRKDCRPRAVSSGAVIICVRLSKNSETKLSYKLSSKLFKVLSQLANTAPEKQDDDEDFEDSQGEDHQAFSAVQSNGILLVMMQLSEAIDNMASDQKAPDAMQVQHNAKDIASSTLSRDYDLRNACKLDGSKVPKIMMACSDCSWQKWHPAEDNGEILAEPCLPSPLILHDVFSSDVTETRMKNEAEIATVMSEDTELKEYYGVQKKRQPSQELMSKLILSTTINSRAITAFTQMHDGGGGIQGLRMRDTVFTTKDLGLKKVASAGWENSIYSQNATLTHIMR